MQEAFKPSSESESKSSETECGTRYDIEVIKHLCTVSLFICNDTMCELCLPISFSDKFVLLSLKSSQNLIV